MKKFKLQLQDIDGNVEKESEIELGENDTLIMQFPKEVTIERARTVYEIVKEGINNGRFIVIPNEITFKVIKYLD